LSPMRGILSHKNRQFIPPKKKRKKREHSIVTSNHRYLFASIGMPHQIKVCMCYKINFDNIPRNNNTDKKKINFRQKQHKKKIKQAKAEQPEVKVT